MMYIDTNVCLYLLGYGDVRLVEKAVKRVGDETCVVSDIVLLELEYVLRKKLGLGRAELSEHIMSLINDAQFRCSSHIGQAVLDTYKASMSVSFADLLLCAEAATAKAKLLTNDVDLHKRNSSATILL